MGLNDAPFDIIGCPHANCTYMSRAVQFRRGRMPNIGQKTGFFGPGGGIAGRPCNSISQWRRLAQKSPTKSFLDINCIGFSLGAYRSEVVDFPQANGASAVCRVLAEDPLV